MLGIYRFIKEYYMHQISKIKITVIGYLKNIITVGETMFLNQFYVKQEHSRKFECVFYILLNNCIQPLKHVNDFNSNQNNTIYQKNHTCVVRHRKYIIFYSEYCYHQKKFCLAPESWIYFILVLSDVEGKYMSTFFLTMIEFPLFLMMY